MSVRLASAFRNIDADISTRLERRSRFSAATTMATNPANETASPKIGLVGATGIGIGAIVGGGVMVLAGTAFRATGPSAVVAFFLNGLVAMLTAFSFAELAAAFPENGGAYMYARKVLGLRAAFGVGWVLWFAYIVAGVLYCLGFSEYFLASLAALWPGQAPEWLLSRTTTVAVALAAVGYYTLSLIRRASGGGEWATWGKVVVFALLIVAGFVSLAMREDPAVQSGLSPFFSEGGLGLVQAMGFTFIALQGFEIIGAVGGEVKEPGKTVPKAMFLSLGAALIIYLPLLFVVSTAGVEPGDTITSMSSEDPETVFATAVGNYMGPAGFWLVMLAAVLSTLSALQANLLAASRVAFTMASDRTLPPLLSGTHPSRGTPMVALYATTLALIAILFMVPDLSSAGAAASLIFLLCFALGHTTALLSRLRSTELPAFRAPWFPVTPIVGAILCLALAAFQGISVPAAGGITVVWAGLGVLLYFGIFSERAQLVDASEVAQNPELLKLRGETPVVLVPIANPQNAQVLVSIANTLAPPRIGRVMLMNVVDPNSTQHGDPVTAGERALGSGLREGMRRGHQPLALLSVSDRPWAEISRVARQYRCHGVLLGRAKLTSGSISDLEHLVNDLDSYVSVLFNQADWSLERCQRVIVPVGGRGSHQALRARVLGGLSRERNREVVWLRVVSPETPEARKLAAERQLSALADDSTPYNSTLKVLVAEDSESALLDELKSTDLLLLGLAERDGRKTFGAMVPRLIESSPCAVLVIARADERPLPKLPRWIRPDR